MTSVGPYSIESTLAKGGMGILYLGTHGGLGRRVAIKQLAPELTREPEFRDRFSAEARTQALLHHPNIVTIYDLFEEAGEFYIVMEFVAGASLEERLREHGALDLGASLEVAGQMLSALDYAHSEGVIHRDVKPSNILIGSRGWVKLTDFGIALLVGDKRLTASRTTIGTPLYMSPEQVLRPRQIDHRSDIYSAGVVLFEMLAGRPPFDADTDYEIQKAHVEMPPDLSLLGEAMPAPVKAAIAAALAKDPEQRFPSARAFLWALQAGAGAEAGAAAPPPVPPVLGASPSLSPVQREGAALTSLGVSPAAPQARGAQPAAEAAGSGAAGAADFPGGAAGVASWAGGASGAAGLSGGAAGAAPADNGASAAAPWGGGARGAVIAGSSTGLPADSRTGDAVAAAAGRGGAGAGGAGQGRSQSRRGLLLAAGAVLLVAIGLAALWRRPAASPGQPAIQMTGMGTGGIQGEAVSASGATPGGVGRGVGAATSPGGGGNPPAGTGSAARGGSPATGAAGVAPGSAGSAVAAGAVPGAERTEGGMERRGAGQTGPSGAEGPAGSQATRAERKRSVAPAAGQETQPPGGSRPEAGADSPATEEEQAGGTGSAGVQSIGARVREVHALSRGVCDTYERSHGRRGGAAGTEPLRERLEAFRQAAVDADETAQAAAGHVGFWRGVLHQRRRVERNANQELPDQLRELIRRGEQVEALLGSQSLGPAAASWHRIHRDLAWLRSHLP